MFTKLSSEKCMLYCCYSVVVGAVLMLLWWWWLWVGGCGCGCGGGGGGGGGSSETVWWVSGKLYGILFMEKLPIFQLNIQNLEIYRMWWLKTNVHNHCVVLQKVYDGICFFWGFKFSTLSLTPGLPYMLKK